MTTTPILQITEVSASQNQKEVTINDGLVGIENATQANLAVSLATGNAATLSLTQFVDSFAFQCSGQTASAILTVPLSKRFFLVENLDPTHQVTVQGTSGTTVIVPGAATTLIFCDGTNCIAAGSGSGGSGGVTSLSAGTGVALSASTGAVTASLANIANNDFLANTSGSSAAPVATTLTAYLDSVLGTSSGAVVYRGTGGWTTFNLDNAIQGIYVKPSATLATAAALPANTYSNGSSGVGATLTATSNAALTVDGIAVVVGNTILVKNEVTSANNGLYVVTQTGSGSVPYILTRSVDMDQTGEFLGALVAVEEFGAANASTLWLCTAAGAVTPGTTAVPFTALASGLGGTVTQVVGGPGTTGGTITTTGTISGLYQAGTVAALGNGLVDTSGTLAVLVDSNFAFNGGTVVLANVAASTLFGNSGTVSGEPHGTIAIGSGLSLSAAGTLVSTGSGGSVTQVVGGPGTTGGTITTAGTISGLFQASGTVAVTALGENIAINSGTIVGNQPVVTITGTHTAAVGDRGKLFVANSTTATALVLPGSLDANGWYADIINTNTGTLTLTPGTGVVINNTTTGVVLLVPEFTSTKIVNDGGTNWYTPPGLAYWQPGAGQVFALGSGLSLIGGTLAATANLRTLAFSLIGASPSGQKFFIPLTQAGTLLANGGTIAVSPGANPTATQTLVVSTEHAGTITAQGTISINTGGTVSGPTFSAVAVAAGDSVGITNQATADSTFANWSFGLQFAVT